MSEENNNLVDNVVAEPTPVEAAPVIEAAPVEAVVVESAPVEAAPIEEAPHVEPAPVFEPAPHVVVEDTPPAPEANVIMAPSNPVSEVPAVGIVANGVIGSTVTKVEPLKRRSEKKSGTKEETVAIFSTKNVTWSEVGKVYRGYNIVSKSAADKWLTRNHVRLATPEEVAKEFGK